MSDTPDPWSADRAYNVLTFFSMGGTTALGAPAEWAFFHNDPHGIPWGAV